MFHSKQELIDLVLFGSGVMERGVTQVSFSKVGLSDWLVRLPLMQLDDRGADEAVRRGVARATASVDLA